MPHERAKLADADIAKIAEWIDLGAAYDKPFVEKDDAAWTRKVIAAEAKKHWAYQPLRGKPEIRSPKSEIRSTASSSAKLEEAGLKPNPPADKRTLIRRVYFDLIGLPPTPGGGRGVPEGRLARTPTRRWSTGCSPAPHYGERWARHWLDLARFAESHGFEHDYDRPTAYHYRDFVIKALNQRLAVRHVRRSGRSPATSSPRTTRSRMMATGFLAAGVHSTQITENEVEKHRYDELDDMLGNIGTAFLGLTVGCARCHDHKFDPIPARDYYRMLSTFTTTVRSEVDLDLDVIRSPSGRSTGIQRA